MVMTGTASGSAATCPDANELASYIDRRLIRDVHVLIRRHVRDCPACRDNVLNVVQLSLPRPLRIFRRCVARLL
jgi:hypothetical protein